MIWILRSHWEVNCKGNLELDTTSCFAIKLNLQLFCRNNHNCLKPLIYRFLALKKGSKLSSLVIMTIIIEDLTSVDPQINNLSPLEFHPPNILLKLCHWQMCFSSICHTVRDLPGNQPQDWRSPHTLEDKWEVIPQSLARDHNLTLTLKDRHKHAQTEKILGDCFEEKPPWKRYSFEQVLVHHKSHVSYLKNAILNDDH